MAKYSFLTTKSWRIDVDAKNPRQAYKKAIKEWEKALIESDRGYYGFLGFVGKLTNTYFKYGKKGIAPLDVRLEKVENNPKKDLYQIWHAPDGKRFTDVVKQGKDVGKLWDYLLINPEIRKYLVVNRQAKFRLINATTKQIIAELPKLKKTLRANPKRTGPVFLDAHRKKHPWVQYITKEGEVIYPPAPAVHLSRKEALRIKKAWEKMELPFMKYRLVPLKYGGWGVEGISSWRTNPVKDIRIQICEYLTKLKRPITEENIGFAYRAITGKLLTMRELADLDESIEKMLRR